MEESKDKIVLVTGGTSGIGFATAKRFLKSGAKVIITGRNEEKAKSSILTLEVNLKDNIFFFRSDVSIKKDVDNLFEYIKEHYKNLDIAINNASIIKTGKLIHEVSIAEYSEVIDVVLTGTFLCMQKEIEIMLKQKKGSIINISSNVGMRANTYGSSPYIASKHAVIGLTSAAALEYASVGIRVNAVLPGLTETDMLKNQISDHNLQSMINNNPMRRLIKPAEIAEAIFFISSDEASALNGVALPVDCGKMVKS